MKLSTAACLGFCLLLGWSATSYGQLLNGNFEGSFYGSGVPTAWKANTVAGNDNLRDTTHLSPFTNVYPLSANSVRLTGGNTNGVSANLVQDFGPSTSQFNLSFDFCLDAVNDAAWRLRIGSGPGTNFDILINAAGSLQFAGSTNMTVAALTPGTWYQFAATVNDMTRSISGSLTPFGGVSVLFSGSLYVDGPSSSDQVEFRDFSPNQNPMLYVDNVSLDNIPEPSTMGLLVAGLALLGVLRCKRFAATDERFS